MSTPVERILEALPGHWRVVPVQGKRPNAGPNWPAKAMRVDHKPELPAGADGWGLLLGPASGVIDVECDGPDAETEYARLAGPDAPVCPCWQSSRGKHRLFRWCPELSQLPASIKLGGGLEVRIGHDRAQSVLPPAGGRHWLVHPDACEPPALPPNLQNAILATAANRNSNGEPARGEYPSEPADDGRIARCLAACRRIDLADANDGSRRLYTLLCRCVEYDLPDAAAIRIIRTIEQEQPFPRVWSDAEILVRLRQAERRVERGAELLRLVEEPWPEIVPLDVPDLPEFPTHVLPEVLRRWVEAESHATQTPADLAGLLAMAVCSACIARRVVVEPRAGWREPVNLFTAVLLEPGNRKSAVFADAMKPLRELEAELIEAARPTVARTQSERRQAEARLRKLEKLAAEKDDAEARYQAGNLAAELAELPEPALPRLIVDDATAEKLGIMLAEQGGRIASMSPEGGVFDLMAGLYSKSGIPQFGVYLMGHSGDDVITDRVGRKSVRVERPALTCAYAMQPAVIRGLAGSPAFRGRGLLARFLYAAPQSWIGRREIAPAPVPDATRLAYRLAVRALAEVEGETVLHLAADGAALFIDWEAEIESMLADGGPMEIMRDWGAKLAGATLRLAAVLHCVEHGPAGSIDGRTIAAAVEIARYLIPHAEAVLNMMLASEETTDDDARYLLRWIERHGRREFTKRDAQQQGRRRFPKADGIDPALAELERRGYIRPKTAETSGPGRPPSPSYEVNPAVFAEAGAKTRSQYSHNSTSESDTPPNGGNFENIEYTFGLSETTNRVRITI